MHTVEDRHALGNVEVGHTASIATADPMIPAGLGSQAEFATI